MGKGSAVQFSEVRAAYLACLSAGERPTFDAVYEKLGRVGSASVVKRLMAEVAEGLAAEALKTRAIDRVPASVVTEWSDFLQRMFANAEAATDTRLTETVAQYEEKLGALTLDLATHRDANAQLAQRVALLEAELRERETRALGLQQLVDQLNETIEAHVAAGRQYQQQVAQLQDTVRAKEDALAGAIASERAETARVATQFDQLRKESALAIDRLRREGAAALDERQAVIKGLEEQLASLRVALAEYRVREEVWKNASESKPAPAKGRRRWFGGAGKRVSFLRGVR